MKKIVFIILLTLGILSLSACATRRNQAPIFEGVEVNQTIQIGEAYDPLDGVTANDREDGDLTASIVVDGWEEGDQNFPGSYQIRLSVTDSEGETTRVTINLTVEGDVPTPLIEGYSGSPVYYIGSGTYDPLSGVTATDDIDGDLTEEIQVLGTYDLETPGTYTIRLRVTNSLGGRSTITIILTVTETDIPLQLTTSPITITLWHAMGQGNTALMQKYADSFMDIYPNVTVVIAESAGTYDTLRGNMINAITAGTYPNMVQGYPDHVAEYLNGKVVLNLNPYIEHDTFGLIGDDALDDIIASYRAENSQYDLEGTYYSLPFNKSTEVMIYNRTVFDELDLDVPVTWQDIITMAPTLNAHAASKGTSNFVPSSMDSTGNAFITHTRQFGGAYTAIDFTNMRGQYLWRDNVQTTAAMQFLKDNKNIITLPEYWDQDYASVPFVNGQTYITIGSSAGVRYNIPGGFNESNPTLGTTFQIGVAPVPYNANYPEHKAVIQQGTNISLLSKGDSQEQLASWLFLKHMINTENTVDWAINTGYLPVRTSAYLSDRYQTFLANTNNPIAITAQAAFTQSGYMFYDPAFVGSSRARTQVGLALERIMLGDGNIAAALEDAYNEANLGGS
ncbi:MAG: extracellular solute-binding protein [Tenericutes bacterium]|nr:extracellular solute-binding protein [Mycoplasmatota bacterium]